MPASRPSRRSSAVISPVKAVMAGKPQVIGLEMALAFCTRMRGSTKTARCSGGCASLLIHALPFRFLEQLARLLAPVQVLRITHGQRLTQLAVEPIGKVAGHAIHHVGRVDIRTLWVQPGDLMGRQVAAHAFPCCVLDRSPDSAAGAPPSREPLCASGTPRTATQRSTPV